MNLAIFGGTGPTGRLLVAQALAAGHSVRLLARQSHPDLPVEAAQIRGDVRDAGAVQQTIAGADAVLSCLGSRLISTWSPGGRIAGQGTSAIIAAMHDAAISRFVGVSVYGAGDSRRCISLAARLMMRTVMFGELADKNAMEIAVRGSRLNWTLLRPVNLTDRIPTRPQSRPTGRPIGFNDWVARATLAKVMLKVLDEPASIGRALLVTEDLGRCSLLRGSEE